MITDLYERILEELDDGPVLDVRMGAFWTAVVAEVDKEKRCGLAASMFPSDHYHSAEPDMPHAGELRRFDASKLAAMVLSERPMERTIGTAAVNALLPRRESEWTDGNAVEILAERGKGKNVAMVGHFPFAQKLRSQVGTLWVLELNPQDDDLPAEAAPEVMPQADVVAITATTLMNDTFAELLSLCKTDATVMVLGPSTPLTPVMYDFGADLLSGSAVSTESDKLNAVLDAVCQGSSFRQVQPYGVRLVTMIRPGA